MTDQSANRVYTRSLFLILCKAVHDLYPDGNVIIDIPVSNGYYCNLNIGHPVTEEDVNAIRTRMQQLIDADIPIHRHECSTEKAIELFTRLGAKSKVTLLKTLGRMYTTYYELDGYEDYFYGTLLTSTKQIYLFGLEKYYDGALLRIPSLSDPSQLGEMTRQDKMFEIFKEHHRWQGLGGIRTIGELNEAVIRKQSTLLINVSEALQEKKIAKIAENIAAKKGVPEVPYFLCQNQANLHTLRQ